MNDYYPYAVMLIVVVLYSLRLYFKNYANEQYRMTPFGFEAKLLYADDSPEFNHGTFYSARYNISAKADFVYELKSGDCIVVEHKNRSFVTPSDEAQVIASVIAVRETYPLVKHAMVSLKKGGKSVDVDMPSSQLFKLIEAEYNVVKDSLTGKPPKASRCFAGSNRCHSCSVNNACPLVR